jgi:hypothetical protein
MTCNYRLWLAASTLLATLTTGCQNTLTVRVERVLGLPALQLKHNSLLGTELDGTIDQLSRVIRDCADIQNTMTEFVRTFPEGNYQIAVESVLEPWREQLKTTGKEAQKWRQVCRGYFDVADITSETQDARRTLSDVKGFLDEQLSLLRAWQETADLIAQLDGFVQSLAQGPDSGRAESEAVASVRLLDRLKREASEQLEVLRQRARTVGFGGFVSTDVYPINPSDPRFAGILKSSSPWTGLGNALFKRNVSFQALTAVTVGVSGDSSLMLVMEHPGQVRVYQVSNDPTQLTRNIALLISKATSAAAKFATGGI